MYANELIVGSISPITRNNPSYTVLEINYDPHYHKYNPGKAVTKEFELEWNFISSMFSNYFSDERELINGYDFTPEGINRFVSELE